MNKYFIHFESSNYFVNSIEVAAGDEKEALEVAKKDRGDSFIKLKTIINKGEIKPSVIRVIDNF